jgi:signal transduction histidine kinase
MPAMSVDPPVRTRPEQAGRPFNHFRLVAFFTALAAAGVMLGIVRLRRSGGAATPGELEWILASTVVLVATAGFAGVFFHRLRTQVIRWRETESLLVAIRRESERHRALLEGAADALLMVEPDSGRLLEWNARARETLDLPPADAAREPLSLRDLVEPADRDPFEAAVRRAALARGEALSVSDVHLRGRAGRIVAADARCAAIEVEDGLLVQVSLRDRTREKEIEQVLAIHARLSSVGLLTAGVAHEINNPLEAIANYLRLLERADAPEEDRRRWLEMVEYCFGRIREIVRDLLRFARPSAELGEADLAQVVERARKLAGYSEKLREVEVVTEGLDQPLLVVGDAGRLEQVVFNLLLNAGEAMQHRGRIRIRASRSSGDEALELTVRDQGPGIPAEVLDRIFDPFFTTTRGTGLGLAVSYGIVQAHGGTLSARNDPAGGAVFTLSLPWTRAPAHSGSSRETRA